MAEPSIWTAHCSTAVELADYLNDWTLEIHSVTESKEGFIVKYVDLDYDHLLDLREDVLNSDADVLASAGMGTDEDYGYYGEVY